MRMTRNRCPLIVNLGTVPEFSALLERARPLRERMTDVAAHHADPSRRPGLTVKNATGAGGTAAEIMIYDEIGYWGVSAQDVVDQLRNVTADSINLRINSPGGEVFDGVAIYNALKSHPASVSTSVDGLAASAASFIAMAGDPVTMQPGSTMMIHDAQGGCWGSAADMRALGDVLDILSDNIASLYATKAGGTTEQWRAFMSVNGGSGTWYDAAGAVAAGLADDAVPSDEPVDSVWAGPDRWRALLADFRADLAAVPAEPVPVDIKELEQGIPFDLVGAMRAAFNS